MAEFGEVEEGGIVPGVPGIWGLDDIDGQYVRRLTENGPFEIWMTTKSDGGERFVVPIGFERRSDAEQAAYQIESGLAYQRHPDHYKNYPCQHLNKDIERFSRSQPSLVTCRECGHVFGELHDRDEDDRNR